ncbi:hypothetical protein ACOBV9_21865 (plasmid) [Pseudoalteromonas espejiana]
MLRKILALFLASLLVGMSVEYFNTTVPFYFAAIGLQAFGAILLWRVKFAGRTAHTAT